jgi:hypothetical protein
LLILATCDRTWLPRIDGVIGCGGDRNPQRFEKNHRTLKKDMAVAFNLTTRLDINLASTETKSGLFSAGSANDVIALVKNLANFTYGTSGTGLVSKQFYDNSNAGTYTNGGGNITDQLQGNAAWTKIKLLYINNLSVANSLLVGGTIIRKVLTQDLATVTMLVDASGTLLIVNPVGYTIASADTITTSGTTPSFEIVLIGN